MRGLAIGGFTALCLLAGAEGLEARCRGVDLLPILRQQEPASYSAIREAAQAMPFAQGKLFRVEREGVDPSYLFGTMHVSDPRVTELTPATQAAFDEASLVAFELEDFEALKDPQAFASMGFRALRYLLPTAEERIDRMLPDADIRRLEQAIAERGEPRSSARSFKPALTAFALLGRPCRFDDKDNVLDARLNRAARAADKEVAGLETLEEQLAAIAIVPASEQRKLIVGTARMLDRLEDVYETAVRLYEAGESGFLVAWSLHANAVPGVTVEVPTLFYEQVIDRRNLVMRDRALPLLEEGGAFIAVGAAHLPGEKGLARLFEQAGYKVTRIAAADRPTLSP